MPIHRLMQGIAFDAAGVKIMTSAFDDALKELGLECTDPRAEIIATKIVECANRREGRNI